ncbi:MAG: Uma2 family endonuclease [Deltaproteobacteria bacterium]|nr:Uma2 family endonuclease [Deltaproteobacteria bacterium]
MAARTSTPPSAGPPRAPSQAEWDALTPEQRAAVVESLPARMTDAELRPPEGDAHLDAKVGARDVLRAFFAKAGRRVYVASELAVYYPAEPRFAPDLLAVTDVEVRDRTRWVVSAEGKGLDLVMEVHVSGDARKDLEDYVVRYARLGIQEYFIYDRGRSRLTGHRLPASGVRKYEPLLAFGGRLASSVLGLDLVIEEGRLRFYQGNAQLLESRELVERLERMISESEAKADARARELEESGLRERELEKQLASLKIELERLRRGGA